MNYNSEENCCSYLTSMFILLSPLQVRFPQGTEMLNIFKNYASKTSILDDFEFYESRQKVMQEKRIRSLVPNFNFLQVCFFL